MRFRVGLIFLTAGLWLGGSAWAANAKLTTKSLGDQLICQCGCAQTVTECNHLQCPSRSEMTAMAQKEIAAGKHETAILQDFVLRYGVQVLASPPAKGFNLTVWILPGLLLIAGLAVVVFVVRRWRQAPAAPPAPLDAKLLEAVEEEMKKVAG